MIIRGTLVEPRTSEEIALIANDLRRYCEKDHAEWFPIVPVVELIAGDGFQVLTAEDIGRNEGLTFPDLGVIQIREDVYDAACKGNGRARDTMAHELGHFILHRGMSMARPTSRGVPRLIEDSEWQADEFAGLLLAPTQIISGRSAADISQSCGLPMQTALYRINKAKHR